MEEADGSGESFRVRVSLERFFGDERARCYVVARAGRRVRWLARRLRRLFPLPRRLALLSRGHLLPPDEPLAVLQPDDPVEVIEATVELEQPDAAKYLTSEDTVDSRALELEDTPLSCKRQKKLHHESKNDSDLQVGNDFVSALPAVDHSYNHSSKETSQEDKISTEHYKKMDNKSNRHIFYESNPKLEETANAYSMNQSKSFIENMQEQDTSAPDLLDSEKIRIMKEQALAVLDAVATRPRRRVRVRRRKRPLAHCSESVSNIADPAPAVESESQLDHPNVTGEDDSSPEIHVDTTIKTIHKTSANSYDSTMEDAPYALKPVNITPELALLGPGREAGPAVLRNPAGCPRAARLVHALVNVAPV